ncbi:hypothetical protein VP01_1040g1 [Puccinia sorghi]|uniref:Uncharacterized protein n=1 Tax=Puccinia sorghi TaxID=27349 RepID=A0A0L6VUM3_9BASI|nr:hypothetical protein VP01_1040g1 [Puccinia sorghi]
MEQKISKDVQTITKQLKLHPVLDLQVCCPTCYSIYEIESSPLKCGYQATPQSQVCGMYLFNPARFDSINRSSRWPNHQLSPSKSRTQLPHGTNPSSVFFQQELKDRIEWFLSLPEVEASIEEGSAETSNPEIITDYVHSRAYKKIAAIPRRQASKHAPPNLVFSMFVDLFSPLRNKLAGKQVSLGVMALTLDELLNLEKSIKFKTFCFPEGRAVSANIGALIGDLVATHKVAGFSSHSASRFCSWCDVLNTDIGQMQRGRACTHTKTLATALKQTGVQTSELNRLSYWDPINNVALGIMHNWFKGGLQHHFRYCWGINGNSDKQAESQVGEEEEANLFCSGGCCSHRDPYAQRAGNIKKLKFKSHNQRIKNEETIENFTVVVCCTNIVSSNKVHDKEIDNFTVDYSNYTATAANIFPNIKILPNHHSALHKPDQMRWWGPLLGVSELPVKILIGKLQKIKKNRNTKNTPMTIMEKFCQAQRLQSLHGLDCALAKEKHKRGGASFELGEGAYRDILEFCPQTNRELRSCSDFPHPNNAKVIFKLAQEVCGCDIQQAMGRRPMAKSLI